VFVVLEGLSGCGKSTASRELENEGWLRVSPPDDRFSSVRKWLDDDIKALEARFLLFATGVAASAVAVRDALAIGRPVVADSWIHRTIATHHVLGCSVKFRDLNWLPQPDFVFFLDCSEKVRQSRRAARGTRDSYWKDICEIRSMDVREAYFRIFQSVIRVDADIAAHAVVARIKTHLRHA
jgi:thymidylate kinase